MAIQNRRGNSTDFNPNLLMPGEFAISQDNSKVYICIVKGRVIELANSTYIQELIADLEDDLERLPAIVAATEQYKDLAKSYAEGTGGVVRPGDATDNSKYYYEQVVDIVDTTFPQFSVDFTTGELMYDRATIYTFGIDYSTGDLAVTMPS